MKKLFYIFLSRPVTSGMLFVSVIVLGLVSLFNIPVELSPNAEFPRLSVSVSWSGVSPEAVEAFVTAPIEAELAAVKGVKKITSRSSEGSAYINLEFHPEVDMDFARIEINEKLHSIKEELPVGIGIPRLSDYVPEDLKDLQGFLTYTVSGPDNASEIRKYVIDNMLYALRAINGVFDVSVRGGTEREIEITVDYEKAKALSVSQEQIQKAANDVEYLTSAGMIYKKSSQHFIKVANEITDVSLLYEQPVKVNPDGSIIRLRDIAVIIDDYKEPDNYYRINGKETVSLIISKEPGTNTLEVAESVKRKISEFDKNLPGGYGIKKEIDKSESIEEELNELYSSGIYSFLIIIVVLLIIFRNIRYSIIITASIIFSLLFSFILFYVFNLPLNILTISAFILGFGFMVDNSIVVVDYLDKHYQNKGIKTIAVHLRNIFFPVFASTLTTLAVFIPLLFLTGELRIYFEQFALGIVFTLSASLIVSFTVIPLLYYKSYKYNRGKSDTKESFVDRVYIFILKKLKTHKKITFTAAMLLVGLPVWLLPTRIETPVIGDIYNSIFDTQFYDDIKPYVNYTLGGSINLFFNHITRGEVWQYGEETYLVVRLELPHGNSIDRINDICKKFEAEVLNYEGQFNYITANVYSEENAYIRIDFSEAQSYTAFPYMLKNYLTAFATSLGGLVVSVYGFGPGFYNGGGGTSSYSVTVKGFNYLRVRELADTFGKLIKRNPRIDNVDIDKSGYYWAKDTYEIIGEVNRAKLAGASIPVDYISDLISKNTMGNIGYNRFRIDNDEVSFNVKYSNNKNIQLDNLENTIIMSPEGNWLKVKDVFGFEERKVLSAINREDQQYIRYVTFDYKGPYKYGNEFVKSSIGKILIPEGYSIEQRSFMFSFQDKEEINIWFILGAAIVLIFMITAGLFESLSRPFIILLAIPFALVGTIFLFYFGGYNLDRGAYAGILLLIGLSVNNSILLVDYLSKHHIGTGINKLYNLAANRLRPVFTTTFTTVAALIPLLIGAESTFWKSLSLSVAGGIFISAIFVVLAVPIIYTKLNRIK